ncbi:hypothetical protein GCM10027034_37850 [Ramlibacter solisilvae]
MPYLQLDVTRNYSASDKKRLAAAMSETYPRMMSVDVRRISVAIRELGDGGATHEKGPHSVGPLLR